LYTFFGTGERFQNNPFPATNLAGDGDDNETNNPPVTFGGVSAMARVVWIAIFSRYLDAPRLPWTIGG